MSLPTNPDTGSATSCVPQSRPDGRCTETVETFAELEDYLHDLNYEKSQDKAVVITVDRRMYFAFCTDPLGEWFLENGSPAERFECDEDGGLVYVPLELNEIRDLYPYGVLREVGV